MLKLRLRGNLPPYKLNKCNKAAIAKLYSLILLNIYLVICDIISSNFLLVKTTS
jgi:hypothetical protein